jgi:hypothetical protein
MDIKGLDKAELLAALFNASRQQGMGFMDRSGGSDMTAEDAREILAKQNYFDYLRGRVMKIDLGGDELRTHLYNRDNGPGAAEAVIEHLRQKATA